MTQQKTHLVACFTVTDDYYRDAVESGNFIQHITEWSEVTTEERDILLKMRYSVNPPYVVVERIDLTDTFIADTVATYLTKAKAELEKQAKAKKLAEEKKAKADAVKASKEEEKRRKLFEKLQKEFGETQSSGPK